YELWILIIGKTRIDAAAARNLSRGEAMLPPLVTFGLPASADSPGSRSDPSALALPTAYSHVLYDEDLHVDVGPAHLFQRDIIRVVVPGLSLLERRKLQHDDAEGRLLSPFQGQEPRRGVATDQRFAAVLCYQGGCLREIFLEPFRLPRC